MRAVLCLSIILFLSCSNRTKNRLLLKNSIWVNQDLKFDTIFADGDSGIYSIYGSGTLLFFDTNYTIKSFSNAFINSEESIAWGEPGIILTNGSWKVEGTNIITTNKTIERTFVLSTDTIGKVTIANFFLKGDTLIRNNKDRFLPAGLLTTELRSFLNSDWSRIELKNSR